MSLSPSTNAPRTKRERKKTIAELVDHEIFADNLILGKSALFTFRLPPHWSLAPGVSRPEVYATHKRRDQTWIASGDAWYVIYDGNRRWALELAARVRPLPKNPKESQGERARVGGHAGTLSWRQNRRGLPWKRHTVTFMTVDFFCPHTERQIKLEFSGWCPSEGFKEILVALQHLGCH